MEIKDFDAFWQELETTALAPWAETLKFSVENLLQHKAHGDQARWDEALRLIRQAKTGEPVLNADAVGNMGVSLEAEQQQQLVAALEMLHPWRKGPFNIDGIYLDTEWQSCLKWARILPHIAPLRDRLILDVGSGNGYYALRMLGQGARLVLGIDPTWLYVNQFQAVNHFTRQSRASVLPLGIEDLPACMQIFDTCLSMGILYHRRDPEAHLQTLRETLRLGGELVLETLVLNESNEHILIPQDRYAGMRNIWAVPTPTVITQWLVNSGFTHIRLVDMSPTTTLEQRKTAWMHFYSLADFLQPDNPSLTIEGYPAPVRAVFLAQRSV